MKYVTESLTLRPTAQEAHWLAKAVSWRRAQCEWFGTFLIWVTTFTCLRLLHIGPIRALMLSLLVLAAVATSYLPSICQALCAHAVMRLRRFYWSDAIEGRRRLKQAAVAYCIACAGLFAIAVAYNVLALSILTAFVERPLEAFFPGWPRFVLVTLSGGWLAFVAGESMLLRVLER